MLTKSFTYQHNGTTISGEVRTRLNRDNLSKSVLYNRIGVDFKDETDAIFWMNFATCLTQTTYVDGLPFAWPSVSADADVLIQAREAWLDLPAAIAEAWVQAINTVDAAPVDAELGDDLPAAKKKTNVLPPNAPPPKAG